MSGSGRPADFRGLRVLSLESRRAETMEQSIQHHGGDAFVAPSVKEIPFQRQDEVFAWAGRLFAGEFDLVVLMTGAGLSYLVDILAERYPREESASALRRIVTIARGPKPAVVLRDLGVTATLVVPEPNTWHEIVAAVAGRSERRIAILEDGRPHPNPEFLVAIQELGAKVSPISVYRWTLPDDCGPLREAVRRIAERACDVVLFTTSVQLTHLMETAAEMGRAAEVRQALSEDLVVGSVGPVMNAALGDYGIVPDIVPPHPKMPLLVRSAAESAAAVLGRKRRVEQTWNV